jgi:HAD superfamily hydrolase (TIGR01509 family)
VRNVIFDIGGVILEWNPEAILKSYSDSAELRATLREALFEHPDWLQLDRGTLTENEALARLETRTRLPSAELCGLLDAVRASLKPKMDTLALLERLGRRQVPLYCLSNMSAATFAYLRERHAFWDWFRGIVISGEVKLMKPEPEIFEYLLSRYGVSASETIFIDDHPPNIRGAKAIGLSTILFKDARQCETELDRLLEVP